MIKISRKLVSRGLTLSCASFEYRGLDPSSRTACSGGADKLKIANQHCHLSWLLVLPDSWAMLRFLGARSKGL